MAGGYDIGKARKPRACRQNASQIRRVPIGPGSKQRQKVQDKGTRMNRLFQTSNGKLRWGWKAAILILGTILFGVILNTLSMFILTIGYASQGSPQEEMLQRAAFAMSSIRVQVILSVLQVAFMLWLVRWLIAKAEKQPFDWSNLGLSREPHCPRLLSLGALLAVILSWSAVGAGTALGTLEYQGNGFTLFSARQVVETLLLAALLAFASGFGEEIAFRGYLQSRIAERYNRAAAVIIVAVLFALSYPVAGVSNPLLYSLTAILVGILFGVLYVRTGSLWMGIALHSIWNYMQIAVLAIRRVLTLASSVLPCMYLTTSPVPRRCSLSWE